LEDRTLLNATVSASVTNNVLSIGVNDASTDTTTVLVHRKSSDSKNADYKNLEITLNGTAQSTTYPLLSFTSIQLQAGAGTDTLEVDQGNGDLNVPVTFLAGGGGDTYIDTDANLSGVLSSGKFVLGDQLNSQLNNLQTLLDSNVYNQPLPIVVTTGNNNNLKDVGQANILGTFSSPVQNALDNASKSNPNGLASSAGPADIQKALFAALGPSGANMLQTTMPGDSNTTPVLNDVVVVANDGTFSYEMNLAYQNPTYDTGTLLDFNPGLAGLPLSLSASSQQVVQTNFGFSYDFKFNIASKSAASIDNSTTSSNPLLIDLKAGLTSGYEDKGATLGLLNADITDSTTNPTTVTAHYHVTFGGSGIFSTVSTLVDGAANIGLHMALSIMPNQVGPDSLTGGSNTTSDSINLNFSADMAGTWNFGTSAVPVALTALGSQPTVSFSVSMDANTFFQDFVRPIVRDDILPEFRSIQSFVDVLDYKVPILGFGLDDVLNNPALAPVGNFRGLFQSIHKFQLLAQDLASFPTVVGTVDLGSFSISQDARVKTYGPNGNDYVSIMDSDVTPPATDPITQLRNLVDDPSHLIADLSALDTSITVDGTSIPIAIGTVNFFDMINMSVQFGIAGGFSNVTFNLLQFPMLSSPVNDFNMMMNHDESLLTWDTAPAALRITVPFTIPVDGLPGGSLLLVPQIRFLAHFAGGFDTHGLEISDPNQGYYLTDADPAESDRTDVETIVNTFAVNSNLFQSTFIRLTVSFGVNTGFSTSSIGAQVGATLDAIGTQFTLGIGITFGGDVIWKPDDPDTDTLTDGLETPFDSRTLEQQRMRPSELVSELQDCGSIWQTSGDVTFGFNFSSSLKIFHIPIYSTLINLATFKIADFNTPPCTAGTPPPLAHMGDTNNNVSGPYATANSSKELASTLYLNTASGQPTSSTDTSQDDTFIIKDLAVNANGTDNLLVISQGRTQEFDNVQAIYADGGGGTDSFIVKTGVTVPAVIRDGDGNDHLEYDGSGSASLYAGNGTTIPNPNGPGTIPGGDSLIGGTGTNILVAGNGNNHVQATGPGTTSITVGDGDNDIVGGSGTQTIVVGNGNNNITFGKGDSTITLGTGANTVSGKIKGGHVQIIDASSTDTDHTGNGFVDQLILNGTANPDSVSFSAGTLNNSPAVQIDDGTATSTWSVTAQNVNTITFRGGGNAGAVGRDGDQITVGDLSSTGVATVNVNANHGQILDQQKDAFTVLGTTQSDNISIDASSAGVAVTGLGYTVNLAGTVPAYDTLTVNGNGGNDTFTVGDDGFSTIFSTGTATYPRPENAFSSLTLQGGAGSSSQVVVSDDADFTLTDTALTRSTGGTITLDNIARAQLTGGASGNHFHVLNWSGTAELVGLDNSNTYQIDADSMTGAVTVVGTGNDTLNVDDTGSTIAETGTLTATTLTGLSMGPGGITYSGLSNLNINLGSGGATGNIFNIAIASGQNLPATTTINGGSSNKDCVKANWAQDFNGNLSLLGFEKTVITIGHALTSAGQLTAGTIDSMTIGPDMLTPGDDMAGQITVLGTLGSLRVAGGTPGTIDAGHVGTIDAYGGYGPFVLRVIENGVERHVELTTPANPYPQPNAIAPATVVGTAYVNVQYVYESGTLANPQLTARITNGVGTAPDQYDLSLVVYGDAVKFNLARLDAAGVAGVRNVAIEGDVLTAVSPGASAFFKVPGPNGSVVLDKTPAGIRLPLDKLAGVAVRDYAPNGSIQAAGIQAMAFGSHTGIDGKIATGASANWFDAGRLLTTGTKILQAVDTYRVPFADLATQTVGLFLATAKGGGRFDDFNIVFLVESVCTPNAAGTANVVTPCNAARGAVVALVTAVPTFDSRGRLQNSVVQSVDLRGDGGSIVTEQWIAGAITSTGPLGDLLLQPAPTLPSALTSKSKLLHITNVMLLPAQPLPNITAPAIFGSIVSNGPLTGVVQTTGQRIDPITGVVSSMPADLGGLYVNTSGKKPVLASTVVQVKKISGELISGGDLVSQVVQGTGGFSGLVAAQGNLGKTFTTSSGQQTRLGGLTSAGPVSGEVVVLGLILGDVGITGGLVGGRIAARGGIVGNLTITGGLNATAAVVCGGEIGDAAAGTAIKVGDVKGILATEGSIVFDQTPNTKQAAFFGSNLKTQDAISAAAIDSIFMNNGTPLTFDLDLNGLRLIRNKLAALHVSNGKLA
jgi:hypothetical protein